jgi:hypothetical protein
MSVNRLTTLKQAMEAVDGSRDRQYGSPEENFARIARFWQMYLGEVVEPHDVAVMMMLVKLARVMHDPTTHDNWVDIAGYAACAAEVTK